MSRLGSGETYEVKPSNNVYTVLVIVATIASLFALAIVYVKAKELFGDPGLF